MLLLEGFDGKDERFGIASGSSEAGRINRIAAENGEKLR